MVVALDDLPARVIDMPITAFDHLNIRTSQLDVMIRWYDDILGLKPGLRPGFPFDGAWLYLGDQALVHLIAVDSNPRAGDNLTLEHFALRATGFDEFLRLLDTHKIHYRTSRVESIATTQVNIFDPDGNHIHVDFRDIDPA